MRQVSAAAAATMIAFGVGSAALGGGSMSLTVSTSAFSPSGPIPKKHTCDGADVSPALSWAGAPSATREFAVICDDPDAPVGTFVHWVIWGIPASREGLPEGVARGDTVAALGGAHQGSNGFGVRGYRGPCPPPGKPHRYFFKLFALDAPLTLPAGASAADLEAAAKKHTLARAELVGTYAR